ncbi:MAG: hypothetical protein LLG14_24610 [Nocardiaceae bacterium]|nr:hypothetical protein [Nocardiaceae bacterium]
MVNFEILGRELLATARAASSGRATQVFHAVPHGRLSQVLLALCAGRALSDHANPGEAFVQVLSGRVRLSTGDHAWDLDSGEHMTIPQCRHSLAAVEDSVVVLTIARADER